ncbi:MAG: multicopper oxidase family protein, partial [Hyphomicrobiaceae bacterium]
MITQKDIQMRRALPPNFSRRHFIQIGVAGSAMAVGGGLWLARNSDATAANLFSNVLKIPPLLEGSDQSGRKHFDLIVQDGHTEFFEGTSTPTIGVNGPFLGPTLKFRAGDHVAIDVANRLKFDTTLHWHGLHVPAKADGGPHQVIRPGTTWSPDFLVKQKAALFWYHSHLLGKTGAQVNQGLAGLILVDDEESNALGLPSEYGVDDIPLIIQDRRFRRDGAFAYLTSMHDQMLSFKGDTVLVNGTAHPHVNLRRQRIRLRLLNGSNARIYNLGFSDRRSFMQIASDGSLLERSVHRKRLRLAPGERAEILVDMSTNSRVVLMSYPDVTRASGMMSGMMRRMVGNDETFPILELRADRIEASDQTLAARLAEIPHWEPGQANRTRRFELNMPMMGGMMGMRRGRGSMMGGGHMMGRNRSMDELMGINGRSMDKNRIDEHIE